MLALYSSITIRDASIVRHAFFGSSLSVLSLIQEALPLFLEHCFFLTLVFGCPRVSVLKSVARVSYAC